MPPEEPECLVALNMEIHGDDTTISGVRLFAVPGAATTVSWYTASSDPPRGYESILGGLVFARSDTIYSRADIERATPTKIDTTYRWNDTVPPAGLMVAVALPSGRTTKRCDPQLEEAKRFGDRVAVYWYFPTAKPPDRRITVSFSVERGGAVDSEVERLNRAVGLSRRRPATADYDIALSFAGEDRDYVDQVANVLVGKGVKVFYDSFEEADLLGKDLYSHFADIYGHRARFAVMFVSAAYGAKLWTNHERKAAQSKAFTQNSEYILPVRFDDTEIPGMLPTTGYVRASEKTPEQLASLLIEKLTR
jgi:hypothetical protein